MPTAGKSPEEWIGQRMLVEVVGEGEYQVVVRLDGISDWGLSLTGEEVEPSGTSIFFPWNRVMAMRLALPEDEPPESATCDPHGPAG